MPGKPCWSKERVELVGSYVDKHGRKKAAEHFGIKESTVKRELARGKWGRSTGVTETPLPTNTGHNERKGKDNRQPGAGEQMVELPYLTSVEEMLETCGVDTALWEVERQIVNKWDVTAKIDDELQTKQNLQLKAFLKHKYAGIDFDELRRVLESLPKSRKTTAKAKPVKDPHLLEINIPDLHYGSLCWAPESGENYDSKIAAERYLTAIERLLSLSNGFPVEKIHFPIGSDFFNTDTPFDTTTAGTQQHNDGRWQRLYASGVGLMIQAINRLREVAPVEVILVQGNHDCQLSYCAAHAIDMHFINVKEVSVDWSPRERKYRVYKDNLVCYTHGKSANGRPIADKLWLKIVTAEAAREWGVTRWHEVHSGHTHHQTTNEDGALIVQHLGSLSGTTPYEYGSGYVGSRKTAHAFVWHPENGTVAHLRHNVIL